MIVTVAGGESYKINSTATSTTVASETTSIVVADAKPVKVAAVTERGLPGDTGAAMVNGYFE